MMNSAEKRQATGSQGRRKRIVTDARKEQNRIAQQLYRKRQKDRIQIQENQCSGSLGKPRQLQPRQPRGRFSVVESSPTDEFGSDVQIQNPGANAAPENAFQSACLGFIDPESIMYGSVPIDELELDEMSSLSMTSTLSFPDADQEIPTNTSGINGTICEFIDENAESMGECYLSNTTGFFRTDQIPVPILNHFQPAEYTDITTLSYFKRQFDLLGNEAPISSLALLNKLSESESYNCYQQDSFQVREESANSHESPADTSLNQIPGLQDLIAAVARFLLYGCSGPTKSRSILNSSSFNPYINHIQTAHSATLLGYLHNARCIGFELQDLIQSKPSPFYDPSISTSTDSQALLAAARKPWIPAYLQPTLPQILVPHHPYLDLLPFPAMRAKAIMLAVSTPKIFDPMELKMDILRGGMYCQGAESWNKQTWEVAPWFLNKWRLVAG